MITCFPHYFCPLHIQVAHAWSKQVHFRVSASTGKPWAGGWRCVALSGCEALPGVSVVVHGNPHRVGHCKGETGGSEMKHKRSWWNLLISLLKDVLFLVKLGVSSKLAGESKKKEDKYPLQYGWCAFFQVIWIASFIKGYHWHSK